MTVIFGTLKDVGGQLAQGTVTVASLVTRPAHGAASTVITKERHVLPLLNGAFESPELDPGPVLVEATTGGAFESWEVTLPEDGRHDLATLVEMHVEYAPAVVGRVEAAAADANRAAQAAGLSATRAGEAEARVVQVVADGAAAVRTELQSEIAGVDQARVDAVSAADSAQGSATAAAADADRAEAAAAGLDQVVSDAAGVLAGEIADDLAAAQAARTGAESARDQAVGAASTASTKADEAAASATAAGVSAGEAVASAEAAAVDAAEVGEAREYVDFVHQSLKPGGAILEDLTNIASSAEEASSQAGLARDAAQGHADRAVAAAASAGAVQARPAMWVWDGQGTWTAPDEARPIDTVLNTTTGEIHSIVEVTA